VYKLLIMRRNVTYRCSTIDLDLYVVFDVIVSTLLKNAKRDGVTQDKFIVSAENVISKRHSKCASYCVDKQSCKRELLLC